MSEPKMPAEVNLKLEMGEVNGLVNHLADLPYRQVFQLIRKIEKQCLEQALPADPAAAAAAADAARG